MLEVKMCESVFQISGEYPEVTFVEQDIGLTRQIIEALKTRQIIIVRGPSKSGKTLLVTHSLKFVNYSQIWVRGSFIKDIDTFRFLIANKLAEIKLQVELNSDWNLLADILVTKKICLVIDDFHYIPSKSSRFEIWRLIKSLNDIGVPIIVIGVQSPQMRDVDEGDLLGRVLSVKLEGWSEENLSRIGIQGFNRLGIAILNLNRIVQESLTSPFLMQLLCLQYCQYKSQNNQTQKHVEKIENVVIEKILPEAAKRISYLNTYTLLTQSYDNLIFSRHDGKQGTLNQLILYAISGQYPFGAMPYFEINLNRLLGRTLEVISIKDSPKLTYSELLKSIEMMIMNYYAHYNEVLEDEFARHDPVIDLIGQKFYIRDPFLLFYLRHSDDVEQQFG
jgi:hypothetical protein